MRRQKHLIRWPGALVAAAMAVAACGPAPTPSPGATGAGATPPTASASAPASAGTGEPVTLKFVWFEWPPAQLLEDFANENYPLDNVTFEVSTVPIAQWHETIFNQFTAGKTDFDFPILDSQWIGETVEGDHILDLTDFAKENIDPANYAPNLLAAYGQYPQAADGNYDPSGKLYGLPLLADTWVLIYRKDLIPEAPTSWDDMLVKARECQEANSGMAGLAFHGAPDGDVAAVTLNTVIWVNGGQIWDPAAKKVEGVINDANGLKGANQLKDMVALAPGNVGTAFISEVNAAIGSGGACMGTQWVAGLEGIQNPENSGALGATEEEILGKLGFAPLPPGAANVKPLGGMGMHVSKTSPNQAAALEFIKWFQQADVQKQWAAFGGVPARTDALNSDEFKNARPWNAAFAESVPYLRDFWNIPEYARMLEAHTAAGNAIITGTKTPEQALNDLAQAEQEVLDGSQ